MPETNDRQVEKLLKDAAALRRQQAGRPQMHPATREMLRTEVRRHFPAARPKTGGFFRWLPRLAVFVILTVAAAWIWLQPRGEFPVRMAKDSPDTVAAPSTTVSPGAMKRALSQPEPVPGRDSATTNLQVLAGDSQRAVDAEYFKSGRDAIYMGTATLGSEDTRMEDRRIEAALGSLVTATLGARGDEVARLAAALPLGVLQRFAVYRENDRLRIVDADGSTYEGEIQAGGAGASGVGDRSAPATPVEAPSASPGPHLQAAGSKEGVMVVHNFSVSGTNRSLGQTLRFSGILLGMEAQLQPGPNLFSNRVAQAADPTVNAPLSEGAGVSLGQIRGVAVLENGRDVRVDAVPAEP